MSHSVGAVDVRWAVAVSQPFQEQHCCVLVAALPILWHCAAQLQQISDFDAVAFSANDCVSLSEVLTNSRQNSKTEEWIQWGPEFVAGDIPRQNRCRRPEEPVHQSQWWYRPLLVSSPYDPLSSTACSRATRRAQWCCFCTSFSNTTAPCFVPNEVRPIICGYAIHRSRHSSSSTPCDHTGSALPS